MNDQAILLEGIHNSRHQHSTQIASDKQVVLVPQKFASSFTRRAFAMGDVADILGLNEKSNSSADIAAKFFAEKPKAVGKGKKPKGMSREVFDLIGRDKDALVPSMQSNATLSAGAFKSKRASALKGKWVWGSLY